MLSDFSLSCWDTDCVGISCSNVWSELGVGILYTQAHMLTLDMQWCTTTSSDRSFECPGRRKRLRVDMWDFTTVKIKTDIAPDAEAATLLSGTEDNFEY